MTKDKTEEWEKKFDEEWSDQTWFFFPVFVETAYGEAKNKEGVKYLGQAINPDWMKIFIRKVLAQQKQKDREDALTELLAKLEDEPEPTEKESDIAYLCRQNRDLVRMQIKELINEMKK